MKYNYKKDKFGPSFCLAWAIVIILVLGLYLGLVGGIITLLWNWLLVSLFNLPVISWAQGVGIAILLGLLGSFLGNKTVTLSK